MRLGQHIERNSWLHRVDGRSKLIFMFSIMLASILMDNLFFLAFCVLLVIGLSFTAKVGKEFLYSLKGIFFLLLFAGVIWLLFYRTSLFINRTEATVIAKVGPFTIDSLGLTYAVKMPLRILIAISVPTLYFMTTTIREFIISLVKLRVPYVMAFTFGLAAQLVFSLGDEFEKIKEAQIARGLSLNSGGLISRIRKHIPIIVPFIVKSLDLVDQINIALNLKHFNPEKKTVFYQEKSFSRIDWILTFLGILSLIFLLGLKCGGVIQ